MYDAAAQSEFQIRGRSSRIAWAGDPVWSSLGLTIPRMLDGALEYSSIRVCAAWPAYNEPVDEVMAELLARTAALGVWLFGPRGDVIAGAVKDPSIQGPKAVSITGATHIDLGERHLYAEPLGSKTLIFLFDHAPSLGLVRLGIHNAEGAIEDALYRVGDG